MAKRSRRTERQETGTLRLVTETKLLSPELATIDGLGVDAFVIGLNEDERPLRGASALLDWRLCGRLSALMKEGNIDGKRGERILTPSHSGLNATRIFVFGFGPKNQILEDAQATFSGIVQTLQEAKVATCAIDLPWPGRPLLGLVDEHLKKPLGDALLGVFEPEADY